MTVSPVVPTVVLSSAPQPPSHHFNPTVRSNQDFYTGVREAIEARGASLMLLPPYSHDLNPIEQVFAKLKALLRKAAPRTREALWRTIGEKLSMFGPLECLNYLRHCGYGHPA